MRRSARAFCSVPLLLAVAALTGCGDDGASTTGASGGGGAQSGGGGAGIGGAGGAEPSPACDANRGELAAGLTTLERAGEAASSVREQDFEITVDGKTFVLNDEPLWEAARFTLEHPAKVHGFSIQWAGLPDGLDPEAPLVAGLYGDFGYNGFDFWAETPLATATRCASASSDGWVDYVLDAPVALDHPGLVYVAHLAQPGEPVFAFDGDVVGDGSCAGFDDCASAMNLPEAKKATYFNGVSFPFPYDFVVRLQVEPTDDVTDSERVFAPVAFEPHGHASFGDYDNDGDDDLFTDGPKLFRNDDGVFVDATEPSGIAALVGGGTGGVFGDYDNDGCLDLFVYAESYSVPDTLLRSLCDGTFADATLAAGLSDVQSYEACDDAANNTASPTAAAAWLDIDADGWLDLYEANFICWSGYRYYVDRVWHGKGDGTFEEWTGTRGFSTAKTPSRGAAPIDADQDGDVDLFVNDYVLKANVFYDNQGDGTVAESAAARGLTGTLTQGYYGHTIGAAWGDLDGDLDFDLVAANLAHPRFFDFSDKTQVLLQQADHTFVDTTGDFATPASAAGLRYQETHSVPALADFDHDGALDLVITAVYPGRPTDFYWGDGDGTFTLDAYHAGITTTDGWGVATADYDRDGDLDVFATRPFENRLAGSGVRPLGAFVEVKVVGDAGSNRAAIGATVRVDAGGSSRVRHVQGGTGKGGQDTTYLHFGLGEATEVDAIHVRFPGGKQVDFAGPFPVGERVWVYESGAALVGDVHPR